MSARPRIAAIVVLAALALGGGPAARPRRDRGRHSHGASTQPLAFNLRYPTSMQQLEPADGEYLHLQRKGLDEFIVEPLQLPAYEGDVGGVLPVAGRRRSSRRSSSASPTSSRSRRARPASTASPATRSSSARAARRACTAGSCCSRRPRRARSTA